VSIKRRPGLLRSDGPPADGHVVGRCTVNQVPESSADELAESLLALGATAATIESGNDTRGAAEEGQHNLQPHNMRNDGTDVAKVVAFFTNCICQVRAPSQGDSALMASSQLACGGLVECTGRAVLCRQSGRGLLTRVCKCQGCTASCQ
jgi:hypothetical protein